MFNPTNFEKVMEINECYGAVSKNSRNVIGFDGIRSVYSRIVVGKVKSSEPPFLETGEYFVNLFITNEDGKICRILDEYTYYIKGTKIVVTSWDWDWGEYEDVKNNFIYPAYFQEEAKDLFLEILNYLMNK